MTQKTVRLHVGAHKTASTYIQETLLLNSEASAAAGTAVWPTHKIRSDLRKAKDESSAAQKDGSWTALFKKQPAAPHLERLFLSDYDVTISDENILGNPDDCYKSEFYRRASVALELLAGHLKDRPVEVMLAVRSYAPFLASIYAESLRHGMYTRPERMMAVNNSCAGQWLKVIDKIRETFPHAQIIVWRYEDFGRLEGDIFSRLTGLPPSSVAKPSRDVVLPSASKAAIDQMIEQAEPLSPSQRVFRMLALKAQYPRSASNPGQFSPWSDDAKARLCDEYEADLAVMGARGDVTLLG